MPPECLCLLGTELIGFAIQFSKRSQQKQEDVKIPLGKIAFNDKFIATNFGRLIFRLAG